MHLLQLTHPLLLSKQDRVVEATGGFSPLTRLSLPGKMSIAGNLLFNSYDNTARHEGVGEYREYDGTQQHHEQDENILRRISSQLSRKQSVSNEKDALGLEHPQDHGSGDSGRYESANEDFEKQEQRDRDDQVLKLARKITSQSEKTFDTSDANPFQPEKDSEIDPSSPNFRARSWAKALFSLQSKDPEKYPRRSAGIAFRNLHAFGYGVPTDYQKTVGNVLLEAVGLVRNVFGIGRRRIDILRGFDGIVEAGEMLVVLGPPGSGCTTFLKTISGETHGFSIDPESYMNYQGMLFLS